MRSLTHLSQSHTWTHTHARAHTHSVMYSIHLMYTLTQPHLQRTRYRHILTEPPSFKCKSDLRFCPSFPFRTFTTIQRLSVFTLAIKQKEVKCEMYRLRWVLFGSVLIKDGRLVFAAEVKFVSQYSREWTVQNRAAPKPWICLLKRVKQLWKTSFVSQFHNSDSYQTSEFAELILLEHWTNYTCFWKLTVIP